MPELQDETVDAQVAKNSDILVAKIGPVRLPGESRDPVLGYVGLESFKQTSGSLPIRQLRQGLQVRMVKAGQPLGHEETTPGGDTSQHHLSESKRLGERSSGVDVLDQDSRLLSRMPMQAKCPREDSNLRTRFRKPLLYPLSYGGTTAASGGQILAPQPPGGAHHRQESLCILDQGQRFSYSDEARSSVHVIFDSVYARACMGAGLAVLSGVRGFLPVAFLALYSRVEFASAPVLNGTAFAFLEAWWVVILLLVLAVAELLLDKFFPTNALIGRIMQPLKIVLGGLVFAIAVAPGGWIASAVGGVLGMVIAGLTDRVRRQTRSGMTSNTTAVVLVSIYEDIAVLVGTLLFVLLPLIGALLAFLLLLFFYRVERRRRRKHKGLRILKG